MINKIIHSCLEIWYTWSYLCTCSTHVQLDVSRVSAANSWDIELNPQGEIPHLSVPMYDSPYKILWLQFQNCTKLHSRRLKQGSQSPSAFLITWPLLVVRNVDDKGHWVSTKSYSLRRHKRKVYDPWLRND